MKKVTAVILLMFLTACSADLGSGTKEIIREPVEKPVKELTIREKLEAKTATERADIKGVEIAKAINADTAILQKEVQRSKYKIEIVEIKEIKGGVEVFARAWNDKGQIGFGKDGSVDIERFRIFNPPILTEVPDGDIIFEQELDGETFTFKYREDPKEALLRSLENIISGVGKPGDKIIRGSTGNTTTTIYPDDQLGSIISSAQNTFALARGLASGIVWNNNDVIQTVVRRDSSGKWYCGRGYYVIDTSVIGNDDTITSVKLYKRFYYTANDSTDGDGYNYIGVTAFSPADEESVASGDFSEFGDTELSGAKSIGDIGTGGHTEFVFNASGIAYIDKEGYTPIMTRVGYDIVNSAPTLASNKRIAAYSDEHKDADNDPYIVIEHEGGAAPTVTPTPTANIIYFE